ncbi:MAG: hypothetical protein J5504_04835 [Butyrivibrio sp.]|nr:hypothetical protein [Butyrivibrio sp.]
MYKKVIKNIIACTAVFALCVAGVPGRQTYAADNLNIKAGENDFKSTLQPGYYDSITIDASKVYEKGLSDGKANAAVITKVNSITVYPGTNGKFTSDGSNAAKKFTESNMNQFTLAVSGKNSWYKFSKWNITFNGADLVYTASWDTVSREYSSDSYVTLDATGIYQLGVYGGCGTTLGGSGASLTGRFRLERDGVLLYTVNAGKVGGGGGYTGVFYRRPGSGAFYPLLVAGGGADGHHIEGGVQGDSHFDRYMQGGSGRDYHGQSSTGLDENSSYDANAMSPSGIGPSYGAKFSKTFNSDQTFYGGAGWRGGNNGIVQHYEALWGPRPEDYGGINTIWNHSTAGSSHYITSSEASAWGLSDVCAPLYSSCSFSGGSSTNAHGTIALISEG